MSFELSPEDLARVIQIESGGNPNARTGKYSGLFMREDGSNDPTVFKRDYEANARAVEKRLGRDITPAEAYMVHQQGTGGFYNHATNPDRPAYLNMLDTAEGRQKGIGWAKQAVWGNMTPAMKSQYGDVKDVPSSAFLGGWGDRYAGIRPAPTQVAQAPQALPAPQAPTLGAPTAPVSSQPMGNLPAFNFTPYRDPPMPAAPPPPKPPAPNIDITQFQNLAPLMKIASILRDHEDY